MNKRVAAALDLVPVLLAVVLVAGLVYSLVSLLFVGHPDIGWSEHVLADAKAIARGHFPYGDPGTGYVGMLYTPLFPSVVAVLLKITWWEGWGPFVSMVAVGVTLGALGRFAWRSGPDVAEDRLTTLARVALVVALPLAAFTIFSTNGVFEGRTDQLAWCFFVLGALRVLDDVWHEGARGVRGRVVTGVLLALSVLTKQTTIAACGTAAVVAALVWWRSQSRARRVPVEGLTFAGVLVVVFGALQVASDGFAFDLLFGVPRRHARVTSMRHVLALDVKLLIVPIVLVIGALVVGLVVVRRRAGAAADAADGAAAWWKSPAVLTIAAAVVIGLTIVPGSALAQAKQGGDYNALAGPVWGMALIFATTMVVTPPEWSRTAVRAIGATLLVIGVLPLASTSNDLHRFDGRALGAPSLDLTRDWQTVPHDLVAAANHDTTVFDWAYPSYSVAASSPAYPGGGAPPDLAAAGYAPRWIVRDLLDGRWDRVRLYPTAPGADLGIIDIYASGYGQRDTAWAWKINYLIKHGYTRVANARNGEDFYTPGPRLADVQGLARCFGPYQAGRLGIRVRDGGGLWCIHGNGTTLRLDDGPNPTSELVLDADEAVSFDLRGGAAETVRLVPLDDSGNPLGAGCEQDLSGDAKVTIHVDPAAPTSACGGHGSVGTGGSSIELDIGGSHVALVVDVGAHVRLQRFKSAGQDVRVRLHNPTPSEL